MSDFYQQNYREYHKKTFRIDPSSILLPPARRLAPGSVILDAGCGSGRDLLWLKNRGFHVTGFERSPGLAELARENAGCEVIQGDFELYDFSGFSADAIVLTGALVHIPHRRFRKVFENITAGLKNRGYVLVSLKEGTGKKTGSDGRIFYLWQDGDLRELFADSGFAVLDFSRQGSVMGTGEVWLGYVLRRTV